MRPFGVYLFLRFVVKFVLSVSIEAMCRFSWVSFMFSYGQFVQAEIKTYATHTFIYPMITPVIIFNVASPDLI